MESGVKVSVAILSWNAASMIERAARSALDQTYSDIDVVVVDNGSTDGSVELLPVLESLGCRTPRNATNLGYAAGMNVAYDASDGDVFVAMNCDAVLHPEFVANAVAVLHDHPQVAIVGGLVYRVDGPTFSWPEESSPRPRVDGFVVGLSRSMRTRLLPDASEVAVSFKANGACPVLRRAATEQIRAEYGQGPFDPVFDTYGEDVDLAFKAWTLGWHTVVSPTVVAAHERSYGKGSRVFDRESRLRVNSIAARHLNAWRHLPHRMLAGTVPRLVGGDLALTARQLTRGDAAALQDVWRAWMRVWRQRSELRQFREAHPPLPATVVRHLMEARTEKRGTIGI